MWYVIRRAGTDDKSGTSVFGYLAHMTTCVKEPNESVSEYECEGDSQKR